MTALDHNQVCASDAPKVGFGRIAAGGVWSRNRPIVAHYRSTDHPKLCRLNPRHRKFETLISGIGGIPVAGRIALFSPSVAQSGSSPAKWDWRLTGQSGSGGDGRFASVLTLTRPWLVVCDNNCYAMSIVMGINPVGLPCDRHR